jgi:Family of unknown function (DUF6085)
MMKVIGYCPMGCGQHLVLNKAGRIECTHDHCPDPDAAHKVLDDNEPHHIVTLSRTGFTIRHPIAERLGDALLHCALHTWLMNFVPADPGVYRVFGWRPDGSWLADAVEVDDAVL